MNHFHGTVSYHGTSMHLLYLSFDSGNGFKTVNVMNRQNYDLGSEPPTLMSVLLLSSTVYYLHFILLC